MNSQLYFLFFAAFCGFAAAAQSDAPGIKKLNITTNANTTHRGEPFLLTCEYEISKPSRQGQNKDDDWELTVAFHNGFMGMDPNDRNPIVAEFRRTYLTNGKLFKLFILFYCRARPKHDLPHC